jgi:hypothetical protein
MACTDAIAKAVLNDCTNIPVGGLEKTAWAMNRADHTFTMDVTVPNLVTAIANASGKQAYTVKTVKKDGNVGFDAVIQDNMSDTFLHYYAIQPFERDAAAIANIDSMQDIVMLVELKGQKTEGCFQIYGMETGLYKSSATKRANDNNGLPTYEFTTMEGQGERYSRYIFWDTDYATTKAAAIALETPGV